MMTPFKTVLVLLLFALPFSRSSSRDDAKVELRSVLKSTCVDWWPKRCKLKSQRQPKRFRNNCGKKNNQFGFCCKTCNDLHKQGLVTDSKPDDMSPPVVWPVMNLEKQIETCRKENIKTHNDEISSSCDPGYVPHNGSCKVQVLMYSRTSSQVSGRTVQSYTLEGDRDPVKNGELEIPIGDTPGIVYNSQLCVLELIGDYYSKPITASHKMTTIDVSTVTDCSTTKGECSGLHTFKFGAFKDAPNSLFNGDLRFEVAYSQNVGTLVFSGSTNGHKMNGHKTQVYIITQNSDWKTVENSEKYLTPFRKTHLPYSDTRDYFGFEVVEQDNKIYLIGEYNVYGGGYNTVQCIDFTGVETLQDAKSKQWNFMATLKSRFDVSSTIYSNEQILVVGQVAPWNDPLGSTLCQKVHYLDLATNTTGFYATTNHCGKDGYGIRQAGMYSTVNGTVSKFGGYMAESHCIQETATFGDLDKPWKCISDSESPLEGLRVYADGRSGTTRFVNFFL